MNEADILKHEGKYYLIIIDYFSCFIEIIYLNQIIIFNKAELLIGQENKNNTITCHWQKLELKWLNLKHLREPESAIIKDTVLKIYSIKISDPARMDDQQTWTDTGIATSASKNNRSYNIET